jgi:integrase
LMAWSGLPRREAWSLTCGNVDLAVDSCAVNIVRKGGDPDRVEIPVAALNVLRPIVLARRPDERVYPFSIGRMEQELRRLGKKLGIVVSPHDLRRSFGRNLYYVHHVDIAVIAQLYYHSSTEMTLYYIGASEDAKRAAVRSFDKPGPRPAEAVIAGS